MSNCNNNSKISEQQLCNKQIFNNREQLEAVSRIAFRIISPQAPFIIYGPPGTRKTTAIVEAIIQLTLQKYSNYLNPCRILVTSTSNEVYDSVALKIMSYFRSIAKTPPLLRYYSRTFVEKNLSEIPELLLSASNVYDPNVQVENFPIVVATTITTGKLFCDKSFPKFTHVFIDEAGTASEPETLVAIVNLKQEINDSCHIILSGDYKQLGPVIKSCKAARAGLGQSLMERWRTSGCYTEQHILLRCHYRSHPAITDIFNHLYYERRLINVVNESFESWQFLKNSKFPIAFHSVAGKMEWSTEGTTGFSNLSEIDVVIYYVLKLLKLKYCNEKDIGVITPYKRQSEAIKSRFAAFKWTDVEVGTVEHFRGREKHIIIASMVRAGKEFGLGFVEESKRINVLISRPKALLIIVGDAYTLNVSKDMEYIIGICKQHGNYFGDDLNNIETAIENQKRKIQRSVQELANSLKKLKISSDNELIEIL